MPSNHKQPAVSDPMHVISTNYNQINSTLDVMQRPTKILSKKISYILLLLEAYKFKS